MEDELPDNIREQMLQTCLKEIVAPKSIFNSSLKEWTCPKCRNIFSYVDGVRICTRSRDCWCSEMPFEIRWKRIYMGRTEQGI